MAEIDTDGPGRAGSVPGSTQRLAAWAAEAALTDIPAAVRRHAERSLLNWFGAALGACRHEAVDALLAATRRLWGQPQASVLGRGGLWVDIASAALINGTMSHLLDFDETHLATILHPSPPVAPAALALAEATEASGADLLAAYAVGCEVALRVARAVYPSHYDRGWHITGTAGVFGAAAAAGRLLGLDARAMAMALGVAASQASGLREMFGTMTKALHAGRAAQGGVVAALLALEGFTSSPRSLEAPRGFLRTAAEEADEAALTEDLGSRWDILDVTFKPFACGVVTHAAIDGAIRLRAEVDPAHLVALDLAVHPLVLELTGKAEPRDGLEGKFSVHHCVAVALLDGWASEAQFAPQRVLDPAVVALRRRVRPAAAPGLREDECRLRATLDSGEERLVHVEHGLGTPQNPMDDGALRRKFDALVAGALAPDAAAELAQGVLALEGLAAIRPLVALAQEAAGGAG